MFYVKVNKNKVKLYNLTTTQYSLYCNYITDILQNNNIFISITRNLTDNQYISVLIQECELTKMFDIDINIIKDNNMYNIFSVYCMENGINEFGIVSNISNSFSRYNISILYINTYNENLIFVNENDYDKALECLINLIDINNIFL